MKLKFALTFASFIKWSVTLISIILDQILNTPLASWAPMNEEYFIRVEISETVKNPRSDQISSLDPLITFRERSTCEQSFHFGLYVSLYSCCLKKFRFLCELRRR